MTAEFGLGLRGNELSLCLLTYLDGNIYKTESLLSLNLLAHLPLPSVGSSFD